MPFSRKQKIFVNDWLTTFPKSQMSLDKSICDNVELGTINILGRDITVTCDDSKVGVYQFKNLLTPQECEHFIEIGSKRLKRSGAATAESATHSSRTSTSAFLTRSETTIVKDLETRIATLLKIRPQQIEPLQVLNYIGGQKYDYHTDWFDPSLPHEATQITKEMGGQRLHTVLIYLNEVDGADEEGNGSTCFQQANDGKGKCIIPTQGSGVFWKNVEHGKETDNTYHSGTPLKKGSIKHAINVWTRHDDFPF